MSGRTEITAPVGFNLNPQEANQLFLSPMFVSDNIITDPFFRLMRRVKRDATMSFMGSMARIVQKNTGCGWNPDGTTSITERDITTMKHKINTEQCTDEFFDTCWEYITGLEIDIELMTTTEQGRAVQDFTMKVIRDAAINDTFLLAWFSDVDSVDAFLAQNNGWFKDIEADVASGATPSIATGSGAPLAAGASVTIMQLAIDAQLDVFDNVAEGDKKFIVSKSIWKNYQAFLKSNPNLESDQERLINGTQMLRYNGIDLVKCPQWDTEDALQGLVDNHRLVLTIAKNLVIATDITSSETRFDSWFDRQDELAKTKAKFRLGFRVAHPEMLVYGV
jgi:hypothetical protein